MTEFIDGVNVNPPEMFGDEFQTQPMSAWDSGTDGYTVEFTMSRGPGSCSIGRSDNGEPAPPRVGVSGRARASTRHGRCAEDLSLLRGE